MTVPKPALTLTPSIVGQAEKAHNALLFQALQGTGVDEPQWITLVLALNGDGRLARADLIQRVSSAAHYEPSYVAAAISALLAAALLTEVSSDGADLAVSTEGRAFVEKVGAQTGPVVDRAYAVVSADDLATAAQVLTTITASLSEALR